MLNTEGRGPTKPPRPTCMECGKRLTVKPDHLSNGQGASQEEATRNALAQVPEGATVTVKYCVPTGLSQGVRYTTSVCWFDPKKPRYRCGIYFCTQTCGFQWATRAIRQGISLQVVPRDER